MFFRTKVEAGEMSKTQLNVLFFMSLIYGSIMAIGSYTEHSSIITSIILFISTAICATLGFKIGRGMRNFVYGGKTVTMHSNQGITAAVMDILVLRYGSLVGGFFVGGSIPALLYSWIVGPSIL